MRIGLLLTERAEPSRLAAWLADEHDVVVVSEAHALVAAPPCTLAVVERPTLAKARKLLRARRAAAPPLVVLGLAPPEEAAALGRELGDTLDDLIAADAPRAELRARVALCGRLVAAERAAADGADATARAAAAAAEHGAEIATLRAQRDEVLKVVSHDLRTPLAIVHLQAQLLGELLARAGQTDRGVTRAVDAILGAGRRLNAMIEDLVDLSRFQRGRLTLEARPLDVGAYLTDLAVRLESLLKAPPARVTVAPGTRILADEGRLERILLNLMMNAHRQAPAERRVVLRAQRLDGEVLLAVASEASAVSTEPLAALHARLTDDALLARQGDSLGAGLLITAILVEAHRGRVWAERPEPRMPPAFLLALPAA